MPPNSNAQEIAKAAIAQDLITHPGWTEIVLKQARQATIEAFKHLTYGQVDFEDAQRYRGIIAAMKDIILPVYRTAEEPLPADLKSFFDP